MNGAWRTISVALTMNTAGFTTGAGKAAVAARGLDRATGTAGRTVETTGARVGRSGRQWTTFGAAMAGASNRSKAVGGQVSNAAKTVDRAGSTVQRSGGRWGSWAAAVTGAGGKVKGVGGQALSAAGEVAQAGARVEGSGSRWRTWGAMASKSAGVVGVAALVLGGLAVREAIKFESAFAGVEKTVDGTIAQMAQLSDGIVSMGNRMPASREEIAKVAEAAGQLGVKRDDILGFTEVMVGMGSATNLSSDEAATGLARLMNIMGTAPADVERLGSALVDLGNKGASTESEILDMALRLAGAGKLIGASESDVLALANTMSSLGIKAQLGGGSFSRIMLKVYSAVQDGGDALTTFADVAGMSADQFAAAWQEDPILAIDSLIQGLAGIKDSGGNVVAALDDMGIKGTENQQVMLSLLGAGDLLTESLDNGTAAWGRNNALADEVAKRYGTAESQLSIFRNQVTNVGRELGGVLVPALLIAVDSIRDFAGWIGDQLPAASKLVGPIWDDLASTGENVVKILGHMWDAGGPIITLFAQLAGGAVIGTLTGIAEALEATTGYLADNEGAVRFLVVALGVLGANRAAVVAMDLFRGAMVRADGATVGLRSRMFLLGSGMSDVARNMAVVPDATNRMAPGVAQGVGKMREAFRGLGGAVTSVVSPAAILTVGIATLMTAQANAKSQAEELVEANRDIADSYDSAGIKDSIARTTQALDEQMREWHEYDGVGGLLQGTLEVLTPMENKVLDNAVAVDKLGDSLAELEGDQARLDQTTSVLGSTFGLTADQAEELLRRMDIDLESTSLSDVVAQVNDELATLAGTDPKTEAIVSALTVVGDESAATTDKVEEFRDALDEVFAPEQNYHDAVSAYVAGFKEMGEALQAGNGEMNVWRENGAAVHDSASSFFDDVKDRAAAAVEKMTSAGVDYGSAVRIAAADTEAARQSIIDFGTDAGYTRDQMTELLDSLGWTQESIDLILSLQGGDATTEELAELQRQADEVGQDHMIGVEADTEGAVAGMGDVRDILAGLVATDPELAMTLDSSDPVGKMAALEAGLQVFLTGDMANPTLKAWMDTTDPVEKQRLLGEFLVWYDNSNAIATASMDTVGARLGFTDVARWSAYLDSLTPTAKADLLTAAAQGNFSGLFDAAGRWRRATPVATAGLNTNPAQGGFGGLWNRAIGWAGAAPVGTAGLNTNPAQGGFCGLWSRSLGWAGNVTTAAAGLDTTSAALGFSDVGRYSAYYASLTPTARARLDKAAADGNFAAVFAEASRWREQNPTARAQLDTLGARIGFNDVGRFAAYYDSLTPTAKADLHRQAAAGNFTKLFDDAGKWRRENLDARATVSGVDGVERALNFAAREREAIVRVVESKGPGWKGSGSSAGEPQKKRRWGGIDHYAAGGIRDAKIGRGDLVHWAEPATEAEAYVPKRGDRSRSVGVLEEAASWFDMALVRKTMSTRQGDATARGGVAGQSALPGLDAWVSDTASLLADAPGWGRAAVDGMTAGISDRSPAAVDSMRFLAEMVAATVPAVLGSGAVTSGQGQQVAQGLAVGIMANPAAVPAMRSLAETVAATVPTVLGSGAVTSAQGQQVAQGLAVGIMANPGAVSAMRFLAEEVARQAPGVLRISSPSEVTVGQGHQVAQGLAVGIMANPAAVSAMRYLAEMVAAAAPAVLRIASPSEVTIAQGRSIGQGLAVGILSEVPAVRAAARAVSEAATPRPPRVQAEDGSWVPPSFYESKFDRNSRTSRNRGKPGAIQAEDGSWVLPSFYGRRWGGIDSYAAGGVTPAHITRSEVFKYGEPETGGEAFIPRRGDRERSLSILSKAAGWYGAGLQKNMAGKAVLPMARGGVLGDVVQGATDGPAGDWMDSQAEAAEEWAQRVRESVEAGYDPGLIASTLTAGPATAAPILDGAVADLAATHDAMARTNLGTVGRIGAETGAAAEWTRAGVVGTAGEMAAGVLATGEMMAAGATDAAGRMAAGVSAGADGAANLVTAHTGRMTLNVAGSTEVMRAAAVDTTGRMALGVAGNTESMGLAVVGSTGRMALSVAGTTTAMTDAANGTVGRMALGVAGSTESMSGAATGNVGGMAMGVASLTDTMQRTATGNVNRMADNMVAGTNRGVDAAVAKLFAGSVQAGSITRSYAGSLAGALNPVLASVGKPAIKLNTGGFVPGPNVDADVVDARLTPGEYVLTRDMTQDFGVGNLEQWRRGYNKGGQVTGDTEGMHPVLMDRLRSWSGAVGTAYNIGSGYRSIDEQKRLYALYLAGRGNLAAKPGSSMHNYGLASDGPHWGARNPGAFGLRYAVPGEPWHVEPIEAKKLRGGGVSSEGFVPPQMPTPPKVGPWPYGRTAEASMGYSHDAAAAFVAGMSVSADTPDLGPVGKGSNREIGRAMAARRGWTGSQWNALDRLWQNESGWDHTAQNPTSTAFGIAQFLNSTWAGVGHRKTGDAGGQIAAGLDYIGGRYGNPGAALAFWNSKSPHWYNAGGPVRSYDNGGMLPMGLSTAYNGTGRPEPVGHDLVHVPPPVVNVAAPHVQVFVGNEEITGMVQVVIDGHDRRGARLARAGERR